MILEIVYGSQTGTAEDIAMKVQRTASRWNIGNVCVDFNNWEPIESHSVAVFVCATTGQGDPPDNMLQFWKFIMQKSIPRNFFDCLNFCVFGLGSSAYLKYNHVAKKLFRRIEMLGGKSFMKLYLADIMHELGIDFTVKNFFSDLFKNLPNYFLHMKNTVPLPITRALPSRYVVNAVPNCQNDSRFNAVPSLVTSFNCKILGNKRISAFNHFQDVRLIRIENVNSALSFNPGDVLNILPKNSLDTIDRFFNLFTQFDKNLCISIQCSLSNTNFPSVCSLNYLVENVFDLCCIPRQGIFELLGSYSTNSLEKERLLELAEDSEDYFDYCTRPRRNLLEVFSDFPNTSLQMSLDYLIDIIPRIQPRSFSIASDYKFFNGEYLELLIAVVKYRTRLKAPRLGLCSNYLADLKIGDFISAHTRTGSFSLPESNETPILMVGPGTGVAPFRAIIQHRNGNNCFLFFGCRFENSDYYFSDEWVNFQNLVVFTAFSRDTPNKVYVQHKIKEHSRIVWDLIFNKSAYVFIAGNAKNMPQAVMDSIKNAIMLHSGIGQAEVDEFITNLQNQNVVQMETW